MKKWLTSVLPAFLVLGCGPLAVDFTVGWGSNQTIDKTLKMNQKQTKAQTEAGSTALEDILEAIPLIGLSSVTPTPTPFPPAVKSLTIEFVGPATPVPTPTLPKRPVVRARRAARPTPTPCPIPVECIAHPTPYSYDSIPPSWKAEPTK